MKCPFCASNDNGVIDSRETEDGRATRRRRSCESCTRRFTTYERIEEMPLVVVKRDHSRQVFDRKKLIAGMLRACQKRPIAVSKLEEIGETIERTAMEQGEREIESMWVGEQVLKALRKMDQVAYVRFASVYRSFRDVNEFVKELEKLRKDEA